MFSHFLFLGLKSRKIATSRSLGAPEASLWNQNSNIVTLWCWLVVLQRRLECLCAWFSFQECIIVISESHQNQATPNLYTRTFKFECVDLASALDHRNPQYNLRLLPERKLETKASKLQVVRGAGNFPWLLILPPVVRLYVIRVIYEFENRGITGFKVRIVCLAIFWRFWGFQIFSFPRLRKKHCFTRFLRYLARFLRNLARECIIFAYPCMILANKRYPNLQNSCSVSCHKCLLWKNLEPNVMPGRILKEMYWLAKIFQELTNVTSFLQEVCFWTIFYAIFLLNKIEFKKTIVRKKCTQPTPALKVILKPLVCFDFRKVWNSKCCNFFFKNWGFTCVKISRW